LGKRPPVQGNPNIINGANPNPGEVGSHWASKKYMKSVWKKYGTDARDVVKSMYFKGDIKLGAAIDWAGREEPELSAEAAAAAESLYAAADAADARATNKECDIARIRKTCRTLSDVFQDLSHPHQYQYLLCNFCREGVNG